MARPAFTVFVHLKADLSWLALSRPARNEIVRDEVLPLLARHPLVAHRHFDAEAFSGAVSDIEVFTCDDPQAFYFFFEAFRDSPLIAKGYFAIQAIYPAYADGYQAYEAQLG